MFSLFGCMQNDFKQKRFSRNSRGSLTEKEERKLEGEGWEEGEWWEEEVAELGWRMGVVGLDTFSTSPLRLG